MSEGTPAMFTALTLDARSVAPTPDLMDRVAAEADAAGVGMIILGDGPTGLDPLITAGWLASRIKRAGLIAAVPALHTLPFHAARALSALDFLTRGRAGWAPSTQGHALRAEAIGPGARLADETVGAKALDFIAAATALWDSWDAEALVLDKASGVYLDPDHVRRVHYRGPYFQVMGPLNAARPPQGYPVLVQSDADPLWRLTAATADVLLTRAGDAETLAGRRAEVALAGGRARLLATLTLEVAPPLDELMSWLDAGLIDGVHLSPADRAGLEAATQRFLPDLRRRGLIPSQGGGSSLRSRLGLADLPGAGSNTRPLALLEA
jgi:alkanesulfonate monooxygenase SsuD/methylene tetrahydromethanopterin reductase-like flavin-dependent oxidoreductase (luciferase family)